MIKRNSVIFIGLLIFGLFSSISNAQDYICTKDPAWIDYAAGNVDAYNDLVSYPDEDACKIGCSKHVSCESSTTEQTADIFTYNFIDENTAKAIINNTQGKLSSGFGLKIDGANYWYLERSSSTNFIFPELNEANENVWLNKDGEDVKIGGDAGDYVDVVFKVYASDTPSSVVGNKTSDVEVNFPIKKAWEINYVSAGGTRQSGLDSNTDFTIYTANTINYFYCPVINSQGWGGDLLNGIGFSDKNRCDAKCVDQSPCIMKPSQKCQIVGDEVSDPVTDYTGKTVYTKKTYTIRCNVSRKEIVGCNKYQIKTNEGNLDFKTPDPGWETKDFSASFGDALATSGLLEQMQHIWSGWPGYCEHGWKFDTSWLSDPMTWLSYAMMAYNAGSDLAKQAADPNAVPLDSFQKGYLDVYKKFDSIGDTINQGVNKVTNIFKSGMSGTDQLKALKDVTDADLQIGKTIASTSLEDLDGGWLDHLKKLNVVTDKFDFHSVSHVFAQNSYIQYSDLAQIAMAAFAPVEEDDITDAINFKHALLGENTADQKALAYKNCMASIGLTMPNMIAWSIDSNQTSPELLYPWENPIRTTKTQLLALEYATSPKYVDAAYRVKEDANGDGMYTLVALTPNAYTQAGRVICGGPKAARASNVLDQDSNDGGINGGALANAGIKMALSKLVPPYNLIATFAFQVLTSFSHGNACSNTKIAMQWGMIQYKTNKFSQFEMCHHKGGHCVAKWFWGKCMRSREDYCCYDQILTRIFAEGLKSQLYPPGDPNMWNSCNDLTINDLKNLSFRECKEGESPYKDHCFPASKYNEFKNAIFRAANKGGFDVDALKQQAINSMAIPH